MGYLTQQTDHPTTYYERKSSEQSESTIRTGKDALLTIGR